MVVEAEVEAKVKIKSLKLISWKKIKRMIVI